MSNTVKKFTLMIKLNSQILNSIFRDVTFQQLNATASTDNFQNIPQKLQLIKI